MKILRGEAVYELWWHNLDDEETQEGIEEKEEDDMVVAV